MAETAARGGAEDEASGEAAPAPSGSSPRLRELEPSGEEGASVRRLEVAPRTRGECARGVRPCPWVRCRFHLVHARMSERQLAKSDPEQVASMVVDAMEQTCALDVADGGEQTLDTVARHIGGVSRERARQLEAQALERLQPKLHRMVEDEDEPEEEPKTKAGLALRCVARGHSSIASVARSLGWTYKLTGAFLQYLTREGRLKRVSPGCYAVAVSSGR